MGREGGMNVDALIQCQNEECQAVFRVRPGVFYGGGVMLCPLCMDLRAMEYHARRSLAPPQPYDDGYPRDGWK